MDDTYVQKTQNNNNNGNNNNPQTPQEMEEYFEKLYAQQVAEYPNSDNIIEPDEDNYFSPHKLKYNRDTTSNGEGSDEVTD